MSDVPNVDLEPNPETNPKPNPRTNTGPRQKPDQGPNPAAGSVQASTPNPTLSRISGPKTAEQLTNTQARDELRKQLVSARRQLSDAQVLEFSSAISNRLLSLIEPSSSVAGYLPLGNEVRIDSVLRTVRQQLCKTYVPVMQKNRQMVFAKIDDETVLIKNSFGILEPDLATSETLHAERLDIVLVPLVGFDQECQRMGMGGGYYDRAFEANRAAPDNIKKPLLIGVAFDVQQTASVMPDWWDVPLDLIVTETQTIKNVKNAQRKNK